MKLYVDFNIKNFVNKIDKNGVSTEKKILKALDKAGDIIVNDAVPNAPFKTGWMRSRIKHSVPKVENNVAKMEAWVGTDYARYVEFGTGDRGASTSKAPKIIQDELTYTMGYTGMIARPFFFPAVDLGVKNLEKEIDDILKEL